MNLEKAVDGNIELKAELIREGRQEKADGVQLGIEALKLVKKCRHSPNSWFVKELPSETKE